MPWTLARLLLAAALLAACDSGSNGSQAGVSNGAASPVSTPHVSASKSGEVIPGKVTGRAQFHDAIWGDLVAVTSVVYNVDFERDCGQPHLRVFDSAGRTRLSRDWDWGCGEMKPNRPATDRTGNVFLTYNPGRYDGVIVLRGVGARLEDFGSLPPGGDEYTGSGPFGYYAQTQDADPQDGVLEIKQFSNDCNPSCAGGTVTSEMFVWDRSRYIKSRIK